MKRRSFFEYLGIADVERFHSQFLAWVFSSDCYAIDPGQKDELLKNIFSLKNLSQILNTETEVGGIDIIISTNNEIIVIENKIKTSKHSNQLNRYKETSEKKFPNSLKRYFFLTLIGEESEINGWDPISYSKIYTHFKSLELKTNDNHSVIFEEYLNLLEQLVTVVDDFKINTKEYDMVFTDGSKKKENKRLNTYRNSKESFIAANQLETILQKCYLSLLKINVKKQGYIHETRGSALIDFPLNEIKHNGKTYSTNIQWQAGSIKFNVVIKHEDISKSDKTSMTDIIPKMHQLSHSNNHGFKRLNKPKRNAYVSISKKIKEKYWHYNINDLANILNMEIENGNHLTAELIKLLKVP